MRIHGPPPGPPRRWTATRTLAASTRLNAYRATYFPFPRITQVIPLIRPVRRATKTTTELVYLITALTPRQADPARLLTLIRRTGTTQIAAARQHLRSRPAKALRLLIPKTRCA